MANRIFYTPQITLPSSVKFADCNPVVATTNFNLARAYYVENYIPRSMWKVWRKGPFPPPFLLQSVVSGATVSYTIFFNQFSGGSCPQYDCHLQCTTQDVTLVQGGITVSNTTFCINGDRPTYHLDVSFATEGEILALPAQFTFTFVDQFNNSTTLTVDSIGNLKPAPPLVGSEINSSGAVTCYIGVVFQSSTYQDINDEGIEQFIVERCDWPSKTNVRTFTGYWNIPARSNMFTDVNLSQGHQVAYRVKLRNKWGEESNFSDWVIGNS